MADDTEQERIRAARTIAYEEGRHRERLDGRLNNHEARLDAINGSVDRAARATTDLSVRVRALHDEITKLVTAQATRDAVEGARAQQRQDTEEARAEQLREANEKQISTRAFAIGVAMVIVTLIGMIVAQTHLFN